MNDTINLEIKDAFVKLCKDYDIELLKIYHIDPPYTNLTDCLKDQINESSDQTKIYVLMATPILSIDMAEYLYEIKSTNFNKYFLISVNYDDFYRSIDDWKHINDLKNRLSKQKIDKNDFYDDKNIYFKSIILLAPSPSINLNYSNFCSLILERLKEQISNYQNNTDLLDELNCNFNCLNAGLVYDAFLIYTRTLNTIISHNSSKLEQEKEIFQKILNQTYKSVFGFIDSIGLDGRSNGNFSLFRLRDNHYHHNGTTRIISIENQPFFTNLRLVGQFVINDNCDFPDLKIQHSFDWLDDLPDEDVGPDSAWFDFHKKMDFIGWIIVFVITIILIIFFIFVIRFLLHLDQNDQKFWQINLDDVEIIDIEKDQDFQELNKTIAVSSCFC